MASLSSTRLHMRASQLILLGLMQQSSGKLRRSTVLVCFAAAPFITSRSAQSFAVALLKFKLCSRSLERLLMMACALKALYHSICSKRPKCTTVAKKLHEARLSHSDPNSSLPIAKTAPSMPCLPMCNSCRS